VACSGEQRWPPIVSRWAPGTGQASCGSLHPRGVGPFARNPSAIRLLNPGEEDATIAMMFQKPRRPRAQQTAAEMQELARAVARDLRELSPTSQFLLATTTSLARLGFDRLGSDEVVRPKQLKVIEGRVG
jgi:hypothetical protein